MRLDAMASYLGIQDCPYGDREITGIQYDSRKVEPGNLFVCIKGLKTDGHTYIPQALKAGAKAILAQDEVAVMQPSDIAVLQYPDTRLGLAKLSALWYGFPSKEFRLWGVTGTNGKTTTTYLMKYVWEQENLKTGLVGTVQNMVDNEVFPAVRTTPESLELQELFRKMADAACQRVVMEASSHALKQDRVADTSFSGAIFTNLTQDHMDYHPDIADYIRSKAKLFGYLKKKEGQNVMGVVNIDDDAADAFLAVSSVPVLTYGMSKKADLRVLDYQLLSNGTLFHFSYEGNAYEIKIPLMGKFNIYNTLGAMGALLADGIPLENIIHHLSHAPQVAGRFELVDGGQDFAVVVDYAHTPDGLDNLLSTAREITKGRLITVFGCGGDRDRTKRPIMGAISAQYSDFSFITSDNPRTEDPLFIIEEVEAGLKEVSTKYAVVPDRREAILQAIRLAKTGDIVVIAGKGHENYQLIQNQVLPFDDRKVAREILQQLK